MKMASVCKNIQVTVWTQAAVMEFGISYVFVFCSLRDHFGYTEAQCAWDSSTILGNTPGHELPMLMDWP